ncbi:unnamed protein product [Caenorhabditis auriculariae]|uniref:Uncharacterized protein n=1 Tax=Caenorhabditis auriculariae TaxID=2777116 RepID=A0A8S1H1K7_9PELO|nr:unnamed protein product [Caenorhabditis auriculariae]
MAQLVERSAAVGKVRGSTPEPKNFQNFLRNGHFLSRLDVHHFQVKKDDVMAQSVERLTAVGEVKKDDAMAQLVERLAAVGKVKKDDAMAQLVERLAAVGKVKKDDAMAQLVERLAAVGKVRGSTPEPKNFQNFLRNGHFLSRLDVHHFQVKKDDVMAQSVERLTVVGKVKKDDVMAQSVERLTVVGKVRGSVPGQMSLVDRRHAVLWLAVFCLFSAASAQPFYRLQRIARLQYPSEAIFYRNLRSDDDEEDK